MRHLGVIIVDGVERGLVLQTEDEYNRIHPGGELEQQKNKGEIRRESQKKKKKIGANILTVGFKKEPLLSGADRRIVFLRLKVAHVNVCIRDILHGILRTKTFGDGTQKKLFYW